MSDVKVPEIQFEDQGDLEVLLEGIDEAPAVQEDPEFKDVSREDIIKRVKQTQEELAKTKERADSQTALTQALKELKVPAPAPVQQAPVQPAESEEQYKQKFNEKFYDNPYDTMMDFQRRKLAPEVQRIMASNMQLSRKLTALDPDRKETFAMYAAEIDDFVARLRPEEKLYDADVYAKAHDAIISRHVNEIIDKKVREATTQKPVKPAPFSEAGTAEPARGAKQTIVLTTKEQAYAASHGISKEAFGAYLLRHPDRRMS